MADTPIEQEAVPNATFTHLDQIAGDILKQSLNLATSYLGEKAKRQNILNYNGANMAFTHAKDIARKLNLSQEDVASITPFPQTTNTNITIVEEKAAEPVQQAAPNAGTPAAPAGGQAGGGLFTKTGGVLDRVPWKRWAFNAALLGLGLAIPWAPPLIKGVVNILNPPAAVAPSEPAPTIPQRDPGVGITVE